MTASEPVTALPAVDLSIRTRRRAMIALFVCAATMTTSMAGTSTVSTLVASRALGEQWGGLANAFGVGGTAAGALLLSSLMVRHGRRKGMIWGYGSAIGGALLGSVAIVTDTFWLFLPGMVMIGFGNSATQLARYAAAELHAAASRGTALAVVVWAGTVGAVLGPSLIAPAARVSSAIGMPELAGTFYLAVGATVIAGLAAISLPRRAYPGSRPAPDTRRFIGVGVLLATRGVRLALTAMVAGQVSMVAVMTMTPVHLEAHGHGYGTVGGILTAHMIGMFALAPISGRISDRFGSTVTITAGVGTLLAASVIAMAAPPMATGFWLPLALFLLGYGWNLCFVGGSSLLSRELPPEQRIQAQGTVDALVWGASAVASLLSGTVLAAGSYAFLAGVAGVIALAPVVLLLGRRPDPS